MFVSINADFLLLYYNVFNISPLLENKKKRNFWVAYSRIFLTYKNQK